MSTTTTYPKTWPGTAIIKSLHTPFNWRSADMDPRPLNADVKPTAMLPKHGGIRAGKSFGHEGGTMPHLDKRAELLLQPRSDHVALVISPSGRKRPEPMFHGGAYSKAAPQQSAKPVVAAHKHRPTAAQRKKAEA